MSIISAHSPSNLWEQVCREVQEEREQLLKTEGGGRPTSLSFDPSMHQPSFYGKCFAQIAGDYSVKAELDQSKGHPSCASYWMADESVASGQQEVEVAPDKKTCSNREFLEYYVWPCLMAALESTLIKSQDKGSFGRKKVLFNPLDYLTEYLYNHNPLYSGGQRPELPLLEIPFVMEWLLTHPRPPRPVSLTWTEDETAIKIQAAWRSYLVRRDPEVQELRKWQDEWRFINRESQISEQVSGFWDRLMPDYTSLSTSTGQAGSKSSINEQPHRSTSQNQKFHSGSLKSSSASGTGSGSTASGSLSTHTSQK